jgi:hypothetical protein
MKPIYLIIMLTLAVACQSTNAQSVILLNLNSHETDLVKGHKDSTYKKIIVTLPQTNFDSVYILVNNVLFSFWCGNSTKLPKPADTCFMLNSSDIDSGRIIFRFNNKNLVAVGNRISPYAKEILTGNDKIKAWTRLGQTPDSAVINFITKATSDGAGTATTGTTAGNQVYTSNIFCVNDAARIVIFKADLDKIIKPSTSLRSQIDSLFKIKHDLESLVSGVNAIIENANSSSIGTRPLPQADIANIRNLLDAATKESALLHNFQTVNAIDSLSFLCSETLKNKPCNCGVEVSNQFEKMYLKPCFDQKGNAISIKNALLYDVSTSDPMQKIFLLKTKQGNAKKNCNNNDFEFLRIKKRMSPAVDNILAVSVIAHKDSLISIDTSYVNFFLDSAMATQTAFSKAGASKNPATAGTTVLKNNDNTPITQLRAVTTLQGDLLHFNNQYNNLNFIQQNYDAALLCLQQKIVAYFSLIEIPVSGSTLAAVLEKKIGKELNREYYRYACELLNGIAASYQTAITRTGNLRIFTRILQVPNADEFTVQLKSGKNNTTLYSHKFNVQGGIKIDFSTGVFLTGLNSRDFILKSFRLQYKNDTAATSPRRDTTGNLIGVNDKKLNYSTGLMVHFYRRSGMYTNLGMVTGVSVNNAEFMWLLGGSLMFRMGSGRISLVGGLAFGKQKELDINHDQYRIANNNLQTSSPFISNGIGGPRLPRFFTDTNISTYEKRQTSWFAGITYNFASIKL